MEYKEVIEDNSNYKIYNLDMLNSQSLGFYYSTVNQNEEKSSRTVYDPIHGYMTFDSYVWEFIDTIEFQRLRNLRQLGNNHFIFPGGNHSRFEHSLGVAYLSQDLVNHLVGSDQNFNLNYHTYNKDKPNNEKQFYIKSITLAGLCHDLGHGPFSHLFDRNVIKNLE